PGTLRSVGRMQSSAEHRRKVSVFSYGLDIKDEPIPPAPGFLPSALRVEHPCHDRIRIPVKEYISPTINMPLQ
ncbi:MAG: hypothetical protein P8182_17940, partial [Deltaproteobacteria bacterium]